MRTSSSPNCPALSPFPEAKNGLQQGRHRKLHPAWAVHSEVGEKKSVIRTMQELASPTEQDLKPQPRSIIGSLLPVGSGRGGFYFNRRSSGVARWCCGALAAEKSIMSRWKAMPNQTGTSWAWTSSSSLPPGDALLRLTHGIAASQLSRIWQRSRRQTAGQAAGSTMSCQASSGSRISANT